MANSNDRRKNSYSHSGERQGEFGRTKANLRASSQELQEFLGTMKSKSPQQVLGLVAASGLTQGILMSTLATAVLLFVFTAVPYLIFGSAEAKSTAEKKPATTAETDAAAEKDADAAEPSDADKKEAAVKALTKDLEEAKGTTPDDVPSNLDNLLEGAK